MMQQSKMEFQVGLFMFIGTVFFCLMIIAFGFKNVNFVKQAYGITAVFKFTNGVVMDAPVRVAGVESGKVIGISFDEEHRVLLELEIQKGIVVREDVRAIINALGIMGEKYVELLPVSTTAPILQAGAQIIGEEPIALDILMKQGQGILDELENGLQKILDDENTQNVKRIIKNIDALTNEQMRKDITDIIRNIKEIADPELKKKLLSMIENYDHTASAINEAAISVKTLISENQNRITETLEKWAEFTGAMVQIAQKLHEPKGSLGLLINDDTLHKQLVETLSNFNQWISKVRQYGLLYKEKDDKSSRRTHDSRSRR
ncbi:MAG: MlaD family protein [Chlamydiota bacterium]|nr:MlaD family protein [Chlamydiota bacterium]